MDLKNRVILVTGGGSGIGLELARQLGAHGNQVVVCGRDSRKLEAAVNGSAIRAIQGDVTSAADQARILSTIEQEHGRLDLLVNNAGVFNAYDFASDPDTLDRIETEIAINAAAPLTLTRRALPLLKKAKRPAILFVTSAAAYVAVPGTPIYSGTKALLHHCAQTLREQLRPHGVSVFEVLPPVVDTEMGAALKSGGFRKMKPADLAMEIIEGLGGDEFEMHPGQSRSIRRMSRLAPAFMFRQFAKASFR